MAEKISLSGVIQEDMIGERLDVALAKLFSDYSRSRLTTWLKKGLVYVDEENTWKAKDKVKGGEEIEINTAIEDEISFAPQNIPLEVIFNDEHIVVINKPAGMVVHPAAGNPDGTILNALIHHYPTLTTLPRAGIVHRLDKDTTGLMVVAKTLIAHNSLIKQLQERTVSREYLTLVEGNITESGSIVTLMGRHKTDRKKMAVLTDKGKQAITHYYIEQNFMNYTLLKVKLHTGRTHQIRVHMKHLGHPLFGEQVYKRRQPLISKLKSHYAASDYISLTDFKRQALHAARLSFNHPATDQPVSFNADLPSDYANILKIIS